MTTGDKDNFYSKLFIRFVPRLLSPYSARLCAPCDGSPALTTFPLNGLFFLALKVLANEDTLLLMMFLGLRKLGNICYGHKMFLNKIRNFFCTPDRKFESATNVARTGKRGNICVGNNVSASMCPRLPVP